MAKLALISDNPKDLTKSRSYIIRAFLNRGDEVYILCCGFTPEQREFISNLGAVPKDYKMDRNGLNPIENIQSISGLIKILKELKPEIVFSYGNKPVIYGLLAARAAKVPKRFSLVVGLGIIFSEVGQKSFKNRMTKQVMKTLYWLSLRHANKIFFQNPDDIEMFLRYGLFKKDQPVLVNGTGVDLSIYKTDTIHKSPITFTMATRLLYSKGVYEFIEAARKIRSKYKDKEILFTMLGRPQEGNPDSVPIKDLQKAHDEGIIYWPGHVENVKEWLEKASVFVFPTLYREGTPRCVLEALAMSLPVITTDMPGCREAVKTGKNGFLVKPGDAVSLADAMEQFILHPNLIKEMGEKSKEMAIEKYDIHKVNKFMLSVIQ